MPRTTPNASVLISPRRRRIGTILALAGLIALGGTAIGLAVYGKVEIVLDRQEVQDRVNKGLPLVGSRGPVEYRVESVRIDLLANGRANAEASFRGAISPVVFSKRDFEGSTAGSGMIEYRDGAFFVRDLEIQNFIFDVARSPDAPETAGSRLRGRVRNLGAQAANRVNMGDEASSAVAATREYLAEQGRKALKSVLHSYLNANPVYRLKESDTRHSLTKLLLSEVKVREGQLVVVLDPLGALGRVLLWVGMVVFAVILAVGLLASLTNVSFGGSLLGLAILTD